MLKGLMKTCVCALVSPCAGVSKAHWNLYYITASARQKIFGEQGKVLICTQLLKC